MSETIAITGKSVKLFKGHYTSLPPGRGKEYEGISELVSASISGRRDRRTLIPPVFHKGRVLRHNDYALHRLEISNAGILRLCLPWV
ncbi:MAG: hypothetical protein ACREYE_09590 [Gammaproteobacteria bacterium]